MKYRHEIRVTGKFRFPIDMLRYDSCFPLREEDSHAITHSILESERGRDAELTIYLVKYSDTKDSSKAWTERRWLSFLWNVEYCGVTK